MRAIGEALATAMVDGILETPVRGRFVLALRKEFKANYANGLLRHADELRTLAVYDSVGLGRSPV